jgi:hypothetical protein
MEVLKNKISFYLQWMIKKGHIPNFWCSNIYILTKCLLGEWKYVDEVLSGFKIADEDIWALPPMKECANNIDFIPGVAWAEFLDFIPLNTSKVLDRQYIYDPNKFIKMEGGEFQVFRKNVKKFPRRNMGVRERYLSPEELYKETEKILLEWAGNKQLYDIDTFIRLCFYSPYRQGIFLKNELVALNIFDGWQENIFYRICIHKPLEYLNEYSRATFYKAMTIYGNNIHSNLIVNDGGDLDNENIAKFKKKLCPKEIKLCYTSIVDK